MGCIPRDVGILNVVQRAGRQQRTDRAVALAQHQAPTHSDHAAVGTEAGDLARIGAARQVTRHENDGGNIASRFGSAVCTACEQATQQCAHQKRARESAQKMARSIHGPDATLAAPSTVMEMP